jgi:phage repressor protein C with HTH and peptisase S24 domain
LVKELKRRTAKTIELRSIDPTQGDRNLALRDVLWIARIIWASQ